VRVALITDVVRPTIEENLAVIAEWAARAADAGAQFVLFPEAALTGFYTTDEPAHDFPLGCAIPGEETMLLAELAWEHGLYLGLGLIERHGDSLYDAAVLFDPSGEIVLRYRRIQPQWHGRRADPLIYREGDAMPVAVTPFGTMAFLLCGDLFDDGITARVWDLAPDYLLFPFARSFGEHCFTPEDWAREEEGRYAARAMRCCGTVLMVNQLDSPEREYQGFGGAMVVAVDGTVLARHPLLQPGMLLWDG